MRETFKAILFSIITIVITCSITSAAVIDEINFGDFLSEWNHDVGGENNRSETNGLNGLNCRLVKAPQPFADYGGSIEFTIACDPVKQNYLTIKLWGSDIPTGAERLYLYYDDKQLGYRSEFDYMPLDDASTGEADFKNRFYYRSYMIPMTITQGKTSLTLSIQSWGYWWGYGGTYDGCQQPQTQESRGIYRLYMHTGSFFTPNSNESQGEPLVLGPIRQDDGQDALAYLKSQAESEVDRLRAGNIIEKADLAELAESYLSSWCSYYQDINVVNQVIANLDHYSQQQASTGNMNLGWTGHGELAQALLLLISEFESLGLLDVLIDHDLNAGTAMKTRRQAYAEFFRDGRDWRMLDRRTITNQVLWCEVSIYASNKAVAALVPAMAWDESYALQTVYEAVGLLPFGSWYAPMTPSSSTNIYFSTNWDYYQVTTKGLAREMGYVALYGEDGPLLAKLARLSGDETLKQHCAKFMAARAPFRFLDNDSSGNIAMRIENAISGRHNHQTGRVQYGAETFAEAAIFQDPVSVKAAQLYIEHNQVFVSRSYLSYSNKVERVNDYLTVASLPDSNYVFPMTDSNLPGYAWADEEAGVVAVKVGDHRFYAALYFRAKALNSMARVHYTTPTIDRVVEVPMDIQYVPSPTRPAFVRNDNISSGMGYFWPPSELGFHSYHNGEVCPMADGPLGGLASFYRMEYGDFLVGMNCSEQTTYTLSIPPGSPAAAYDLISGQTIDLTTNPQISPKSTMILYFGEPESCGDPGTRYLKADFDKNCIVDLADFAIFAKEWLLHL